ncbi:glycosyltransferase family 4 protein [Poseidonibacter ostreae]|jgi:glycosyltransferase involved in cell wall biosynthesis|uniref:Glycosyltransferase n=1 Tax=Poseidonibacter ostreae TaxID=2654171 RepID=A0A6L4WRU1_9BACT|nr:glycosyltransferase family 4 protein [Poseidonibacter ostreae]KAB7884330.1 glycosyltransferase [Poseidonibacter ostreae]KAB7888111.1 glycosyltransferase [Poseidonibacter ostreae]KAB7891725.1 glycosyltransferase [Poseidonibacter ostreae]
MRILHALAQRPGKTGSGVFLQQLFKTGHEKKYEQAVLAGVPFSEQNPDIDNLDMNNFYPVLFETNELNFPVVGMSDVMPYSSTKYSDLDEEMFKVYEKEFKKVIKKAVDEFKPDVVICNHIWLLCGFIKDLYPNLKVLVLCHGTDLRQLERAVRLTPIVKNKVPSCDYFFALNSAQAEEIFQLHDIKKEQVITSGSGYNPDMFYPIKKEKNKKVRVVYIGKICNYKGVPNLLNAIDKTDNYKNIELNLVGHGNVEESDIIIKSIKNRKTEVNYLGAISQDKLAEFLRTTDIFILPSFFEGLPLVVIESLASGAKVICTDLPGLDDFLGEKLKSLNAIRYIKMPRLKNVDTPYEEDIEAFENSITKSIDEASLEIINEDEYKINEVIDCLKDKTWHGLFTRLERFF